MAAASAGGGIDSPSIWLNTNRSAAAPLTAGASDAGNLPMLLQHFENRIAGPNDGPIGGDRVVQRFAAVNRRDKFQNGGRPIVKRLRRSGERSSTVHALCPARAALPAANGVRRKQFAIQLPPADAPHE